MTTWGVGSEVGRLRTVLVHQPGQEHRQTVPWTKDALLFDDIMDIEEARPEHRAFCQLMAAQSVEVLCLGDLLKDVCATPAGLEAVVREVAGERVLARLGDTRLRPQHLIHGFPEHFALDNQVVLEPLPNLYFMRDPAFAVPGAIVVSHPYWPARQREARLLAAVLKRHSRFTEAVVYDGILDDPAATIEGGDVHVPDERTVVVGIGERTNHAGADHLARFLFANTAVERVVKVIIPAQREFMHLDTVLTWVDRRRVLTLPYLWDRPAIYAEIAEEAQRRCGELGKPYQGPVPEHMAQASRVEVLWRDARPATHFDDTMAALTELGLTDPEQTVYVAGRLDQYPRPEEHVIEALREQWNDGANALALKPGHVMSYSRNDRTFRALEEAGVEVVAFRGGELVRGRGGARCMTMPLHRDPI
ncbi:MAG TPA: arginine deiminase family protein [Thermoanaerobaculaceae bacterium]|nr:arginine deiminase family protein [Thermoanaerobaculaceae bacterium]HPS77141.1 arginine deiminase family protein [Thermoanaerobaculaceae bacterium]